MKYLQLELASPSAVITLNRPKVRNALSAPLIEAFQQRLSEIEREEEISSVILTGSGTSFCAGADLAELDRMTSLSAEEARLDTLVLADLLRRLYQFPKPVIAAVNGPALAGGCGLASVCDFVLASEASSFGFPEVKVGFIPALVSVFLLQQVGERRARELLLSGKILSAGEAQDIGLVNEVVSPGDLMNQARKLAEVLAKHNAGALAWTKQLLGQLQGLGLEEALALAAQWNTVARNTEDFKEGVASFLEKRRPVWRKP